MLISTLFCQLHIGNNLRAKHRDILTELDAVTELLGDFIFLFSFSALQVQESELFPVIKSMSGIGGLKSSVSLPYPTHKNQNSNPRHTCSLLLFLESLACGKHIIWWQAGPEGGSGKEASSGWGIFYLLGFSWPLEVLTSEHSSCRSIFPVEGG